MQLFGLPLFSPIVAAQGVHTLPTLNEDPYALRLRQNNDFLDGASLRGLEYLIQGFGSVEPRTACRLGFFLAKAQVALAQGDFESLIDARNGLSHTLGHHVRQSDLQRATERARELSESESSLSRDERPPFAWGIPAGNRQRLSSWLTHPRADKPLRLNLRPRGWKRFRRGGLVRLQIGRHQLIDRLHGLALSFIMGETREAQRLHLEYEGRKDDPRSAPLVLQRIMNMPEMNGHYRFLLRTSIPSRKPPRDDRQYWIVLFARTNPTSDHTLLVEVLPEENVNGLYAFVPIEDFLPGFLREKNPEPRTHYALEPVGLYDAITDEGIALQQK